MVRAELVVVAGKEMSWLSDEDASDEDASLATGPLAANRVLAAGCTCNAAPSSARQLLQVRQRWVDIARLPINTCRLWALSFSRAGAALPHQLQQHLNHRRYTDNEGGSPNTEAFVRTCQLLCGPATRCLVCFELRAAEVKQQFLAHANALFSKVGQSCGLSGFLVGQAGQQRWETISRHSHT